MSEPRDGQQRMTLADPCTCGSGLRVIDCCFKSIDTQPPPPKTHYSHRKCFARALGDCSKSISREHFFSQGVLELVGETLHVSAPCFRPDGKSLKATALASNILCTRHNNALSPLDALAKKFFRFALGRTEHEALIIRGTDLEKWLLKLMCGLIATGHGETSTGVKIVGLQPPLAALHTLFGALDLPPGGGLRVLEKPGRSLVDAMSVHILASETQAEGVAVRLKYVELLFTIPPLPDKLDDGTRLHYRPSSVGIDLDGVYREVHLGWPEGNHVGLRFNLQRGG